jgi:hypothetical protein
MFIAKIRILVDLFARVCYNFRLFDYTGQFVIQIESAFADVVVKDDELVNAKPEPKYPPQGLKGLLFWGVGDLVKHGSKYGCLD